MITPPNYEQAEKQARLQNAEKLRANINASDVKTKIHNWAERYSLEPEFVRYKVLTDDTFALQFVKDPAKQSLHQKIAAKHIASNIPLVMDFKTLPANGANAEYVSKGMVVPGSVIHAATNDHGKSIDFKWNYNRGSLTFTVFVTHKHTKEEGGSQDNQFADVKRFLQDTQQAHNDNQLFLAICDGDYYQRPYDSRPSRLQALQEDYPGRRSYACSIEQLPSILARFMERWFTHHGIKLTPFEIAALSQLHGRAVNGAEE